MVRQENVGTPEKQTTLNQYPNDMSLLLQNAMGERATDIHLDPQEESWSVRFRIDGMIHTKQTLALEDGHRLVNQLKVAAGLEMEKTFVPLDGQLEYYFEDEKKDVRITILPADAYEPVHLRILSVAPRSWEIERLGFVSHDIEVIEETLKSPHGLILVSGRTGSGKTTTLYSLVSVLDLQEHISVSVEDPVEYSLPYLRQLEVDEGHGLTMHEGLRTLVRMDPDVILVGEIRDQDSASIASRAAVGGRLVMATIHAGDAARTIEAVHYYSVPYHVIGSSLRLIVSQQLARRLCEACKNRRSLNEAEKSVFESSRLDIPEHVYEAVGCEACNHYGYKGRIGIFETVPVDKQTEELIAGGATYQELSERFQACNVVSSFEDGLKKTVEGYTSVKEIMRIF